MHNKVKKELEKVANNSLCEFKNDKFKEELLEKHRQMQAVEKHKPKMTFSFKWKAVMSVSSVALVIAIVLVCVLLINPHKDIPQGSDRYYAYTNIMSKDANIEDIVIANYSLNAEYVVFVELAYDKESGDNLYYRVTWDNEDEWTDCYIDFIINPYFKPATKTFSKVIEINGLLIKYNIKSEFDEETQLYTFEIDGETTIGDTLIRFEDFSSIMETQDSGFEEFINNFFIQQ